MDLRCLLIAAFTATPASAAAAMQNVASTNAEVGRFMQQYANRGLLIITVWYKDC